MHGQLCEVEWYLFLINDEMLGHQYVTTIVKTVRLYIISATSSHSTFGISQHDTLCWKVFTPLTKNGQVLTGNGQTLCYQDKALTPLSHRIAIMPPNIVPIW